MRHHDRNRKLGRVARQRTALLRSLACSLILNGRIETTEARAKELRPFVERLITKGRDGTVASRRLVAARLGGEGNAVRRLCEEVAPRYREQAGGYTRIIKLGPQPGGDARERAVIEFV